MLCLVLMFMGIISLKVQSQILGSCKSNNLVFSAKLTEEPAVLYYVTDSISKKTDSLLRSYIGKDVKNCFCNDTLARFYLEDVPLPRILNFQLKEGKWKYMSFTSLGQTALMVGMLFEGKKYEKYRHQLVSIDKIISELTILTARESKLIPTEKYAIEYRISREKNELMLEKKTPLKEYWFKRLIQPFPPQKTSILHRNLLHHIALLDLGYYVETGFNPAKNGVLAVQMRPSRMGDEKLGALCVKAVRGHAQ